VPDGGRRCDKLECGTWTGRGRKQLFADQEQLQEPVINIERNIAFVNNTSDIEKS